MALENEDKKLANKDGKKYKAQKGVDQANGHQDSTKKAAKVGTKAAANYFTGGQGGKVVDALSKTKAGDKLLNKGAAALDRIPGVSKAAKKLDDSKGLDLADKAMGNTSLKGAQGVGDHSATPNDESTDDSNKEHQPQHKQLDNPFKSSLKNKMKNGLKNALLGDENVDNEDDQDDEQSIKLPDFKSIFSFFVRHPSLLLPLCVLILIVFVVFMFYFCITTYEFDQNNKNQGGAGEGGAATCSTISIHSTSLSRNDFKQKLLEKAQNSSTMGYHKFAQNADIIYDLSVKNNINPEMVVIRAAVEGFSPGDRKNNYWGLGCTNSGGYNACITYSSFSDGVLGYIKNISQYPTVEDMMSRYAYIGSNWFSPGSSSVGGCYYYPYIEKYLTASRASQVRQACSRSCSGSSCMKTTDEDQRAYTSYQVESMVNMRSNIFGLGKDLCESSSSVGNGTGSDVSNYAVQTFDSFSYSQAMRMSASYVDCSSMVWRAYKHFGLSIGEGAPVAADQYRWCVSNHKNISENELQPGDLIFFSAGSYYHAGRYNGIGHVSIYIGNNQQFAAHSSRYPQPDQVSVTAYSRGVGSYFCRPYK